MEFRCTAHTHGAESLSVSYSACVLQLKMKQTSSLKAPVPNLCISLTPRHHSVTTLQSDYKNTGMFFIKGHKCTNCAIICFIFPFFPPFLGKWHLAKWKEDHYQDNKLCRVSEQPAGVVFMHHFVPLIKVVLSVRVKIETTMFVWRDCLLGVA